MRSKLRICTLTVLSGIFISCPSGSWSQDHYAFAATRTKDIPVATIQNDKQTLLSALKELNKAKGVYFLYSDETIGTKLVGPLKDVKDDIEKILGQLLEG